MSVINKFRSNFFDLYNYYGSALKEMVFERALSAFDKSIEIDRNNYVHFNKGLIFYKVQNYESAEKSLLASLSIKPDFFMTNFLLGVVFQESIEVLVLNFIQFCLAVQLNILK